MLVTQYPVSSSLYTCSYITPPARLRCTGSWSHRCVSPWSRRCHSPWTPLAYQVEGRWVVETGRGPRHWFRPASGYICPHRACSGCRAGSLPSSASRAARPAASSTP